MEDTNGCPGLARRIAYSGQGESKQDAADQLRLLIESVTDHAILTLDLDGYVASWNPGAERIKGYRADEILGQHFSRFYPPEAVARNRPRHGLEVATREGRFEEDGWRVRKDGSRFWANVVITALYDETGQLRGFGKVTRDFTARYQAQEQREMERLREALRIRDDFLSVASHELRTPLTPLQLKLTAMRRAVDSAPGGMLPSERVERDLDVAVRQVRKLVELVDDLLDVSRISVGQLALERVPADLTALLREVVARYLPQASQLGSTVELDAPAPVQGEWDTRRVEQVMTNLLSNALKYGGGKPIHVSLRAEGGMALLSVRDEGIGIAPEALPHVFDRFMRAVSGRNFSGLGLGLFIAHQVVSAHGGDIQVSSVPDKGSTFSVRLPLGPT
ncbi:sensory box histidine kinase [Myxococcus xanthus DK 1622]|uniref:histidine kinase n=1 Tax=Myxococcus xanthus (strain DK1622) TaxID=246197 RepID=Q1D7S2_MYXXD|nr:MULTISPECIES: PAS domain-containing sensor histidine kinase [Myxococcus]ABF90516.1 sensory box histidine kinase [Myxococcus xanthus DK 1622]NOJ52966.1 PAS domain-containing sensor histidine kinase [Myxococcus xanthus]QPM82557.1 PAS domain S-box protein [Myxococcus xanthus]QVW64862.1 PAS domain S-box protein [Myxococcus xanthus DZ2]QZZ50809.1 Adaptive-response sensory-kinase SasA [Myxococcus xanthus]